MGKLNETRDYWRRMVIWVLETNPRGYRKITGKLTNGLDGRCALGVIGEELHIDPSREGNALYSRIEELTGDVTNCISSPNDNGKTFTEIAARLRTRWNIPAEA
jgi:hypothetical protein